MSCRIEPIWLPTYRTDGQTIWKVIRIGANVRQIVGRPGPSVQVKLLDRNVDFGSVVKAGFVFGRVTTSGDAWQQQCRDDPEDRYHGEQLHQGKCSSFLPAGVHSQKP